MTDPNATDPAVVETPAAQSDDVQGHGRPGTFEVVAQPSDEDDVQGHGRPHAL